MTEQNQTNTAQPMSSEEETINQQKAKKAEYDKLWAEKNQEKLKAYRKEYNSKTKEKRKNRYEKIKQENPKYLSNHSKLYKQRHSEKIKTQTKNYNKKHKDRRREYYKNKEKTDFLFAAKQNLRRAVQSSFQRIKQNKPTNTINLLGCTWEEAKAHFESLFQEGMTWENHGEWHIDHIRPVSLFTETDMHLMNHISNLQPLWAKDNLTKKDKYNSGNFS
jgi:hypothetical protein